MKKLIKLSVADFALPAPRVGSIDTDSGLTRGAEIGTEIHQQIQQSRLATHPHYQAEVKTTHTFETASYHFSVSGRMDGVFQKPEFTIEEIKTTFNLKDLNQRLQQQQMTHPYCLQLKTYGYIYWLQHQEIPTLLFHLVSSRNGKHTDLVLDFHIDAYEEWLALRLQELSRLADEHHQRVLRRKKTAKKSLFPYIQARPGQTELIATVMKGMQAKQRMLLQAPTGLGKTMGVLYPVLKEALMRGQRVIYVTPKNSQHAVAEDAITRLQASGTKMKAMTLTAKSKMCFKEEVVCNPNYCEFAKDHYTKVAAHQLGDKLTKKKSLTANTIQKLARRYEVCPAELQFEALPAVDVVICDYNYVFSPHANDQLTHSLFTKSKPNLIIDEAHNLPARALDYYSPSITVATLENLRLRCETFDSPFKSRAQRCIDECIQIIKSSSVTRASIACEIDPPVSSFMEQDATIQGLLASYLESDQVIVAGDPILELHRYWSEFTAALEFIALGKPQFFVVFIPAPATAVKIVCCNAAEMLSATYNHFAHSIGFSATLKPFAYYGQLSGLDETILTHEFVSAFPNQHRKVLIIPQISSKYSDRVRNYPRVASALQKISALKQGNYMVFLPSFEFLDRVCEHFTPPPHTEVLKQRRGMSQNDIQTVLKALHDTSRAHFLFAVQGGVFSEGIDYPGDMVIGVFIVGPPLPHFDFQREAMKRYYDKTYSAGFDFAYTFPAMAKAIQAAGRLIRSETDKGIIIFMDNRFLQPSFSACMPKDWFVNNATELVSSSILKDITQFWTETKSLDLALTDCPD